jgi:hypothetical protein
MFSFSRFFPERSWFFGTYNVSSPRNVKIPSNKKRQFFFWGGVCFFKFFFQLIGLCTKHLFWEDYLGYQADFWVADQIMWHKNHLQEIEKLRNTIFWNILQVFSVRPKWHFENKCPKMCAELQKCLRFVKFQMLTSLLDFFKIFDKLQKIFVF